MTQVVGSLERMRAIFRERRKFARRKVVCTARLPVGVSLPHEHIDPDGDEYPEPIMGQTRDLSESGFSLQLPTTQLGCEDISRLGSTLRVVLCLPTGIVIIHGETVRCEPIEAEGGGSEFLVGARITKMFDSDRRSYLTFLLTLAAGRV
jgi:hypothetical protein